MARGRSKDEWLAELKKQLDVQRSLYKKYVDDTKNYRPTTSDASKPTTPMTQAMLAKQMGTSARKLHDLKQKHPEIDDILSTIDTVLHSAMDEKALSLAFRENKHIDPRWFLAVYHGLVSRLDKDIARDEKEALINSVLPRLTFVNQNGEEVVDSKVVKELKDALTAQIEARHDQNPTEI